MHDPSGIIGFIVLIGTGLFLFLIGAIRQSRHADDTADQIERALAEGDGLHPALRCVCPKGCGCAGKLHGEAN